MPDVAPPTVASPFLTARQRDEERALKRQVLLQAAVRMFNERGFFATSLDDVAASLGVTKPVIYHHLGNKDQVLFECVRMGLAQLRTASAEARLGAGSGMDRLQFFLRRYGEIIMGDFGRCVVLTGDGELQPASRLQFRALKREIDQALRAMIADAVADGTARTGDIRITAFMIAGALNWTSRWHRDDGGLSAEAVAARLSRMLCEGIMPVS